MAISYNQFSKEINSENFSDFMKKNNTYGGFKAQASLAGGDIPLSGVNIKIYNELNDGQHLFFQGITNANGIIDGVQLPAPPYEKPTLSNISGPYAKYELLAEKEGYNSILKQINIYSGIRTLLPLEFTVKEDY